MMGGWGGGGEGEDGRGGREGRGGRGGGEAGRGRGVSRKILGIIMIITLLLKIQSTSLGF